MRLDFSEVKRNSSNRQLKGLSTMSRHIVCCGIKRFPSFGYDNNAFEGKIAVEQLISRNDKTTSSFEKYLQFVGCVYYIWYNDGQYLPNCLL
jgi:hypothetical protein